MTGRIQPSGNPAAARGVQSRIGNPSIAWSSTWAQAFETHRSPNPGRADADAYAETSTFDAMSSSPGGSVVKFSPCGKYVCLDVVRIYLGEKNMWLTVLAQKGTNPRFPNNISIENVKGSLSQAASTYEGKKIYMYDGTEGFDGNAICGGYEYLDDYVVEPGSKLYATLEPQNVAGVHDQGDDGPKDMEWDGLTWVQLIDESRWTQVMLPDCLPDGKVLTANMLKRSVLAKINKNPTPQTLAAMRVLRNDGGLATGQPYKGTDTVRATSWYSVAVDPNLPMLMVQSGSDCPSPDSAEIQGWHEVAEEFEP